MLFNFALEYTIKRVKENQKGLEFNGTHQFLVYADDVNITDENITIKKNKEALLQANKEVGLEVNTDNSIWLCLVTKMQGKKSQFTDC
jgi:hypothetical protein